MAKRRGFYILGKPQVINPAPLARAIDVNLRATKMTRAPRTMTMLRPPAVVHRFVATPIRVVSRAVRAAVDLRRTVRYQTPLLMAPVVVTEVAPALPPPILRELVSSRAPRTVALLQPWTIRGPPVPVVTQATVHTVRGSRRPVTSFLRAPVVVEPGASTQPDLSPAQTTAFAPVPAPTYRPRTRSLLLPPAVVGAAPAVPPVETTTSTRTWVRPRPPRYTSFLRAPVVVEPAAAGGDPSPRQTQSFAPPPAPTRRPRTIARLFPPAVAEVRDPVETTIGVKLATTRKPKQRSLYTVVGFTGGTIVDTDDLTPVTCDDLTLAANACDDLTLTTTSDDALTASSSSCDTLTLGTTSDDSLTITPDS